MSSEVNAIVRVKFKLAYNNVSIQHVSHYAMGILPNEKLKSKVQKKKEDDDIKEYKVNFQIRLQQCCTAAC